MPYARKCGEKGPMNLSQLGQKQPGIHVFKENISCFLCTNSTSPHTLLCPESSVQAYSKHFSNLTCSSATFVQWLHRQKSHRYSHPCQLRRQLATKFLAWEQYLWAPKKFLWIIFPSLILVALFLFSGINTKLSIRTRTQGTNRPSSEMIGFQTCTICKLVLATFLQVKLNHQFAGLLISTFPEHNIHYKNCI